MNIMDLFCGAGGLSYGFEQEGFKAVLGLDMNASALETYQKNHSNSTAICADLSDNSIKQRIISHAKKQNIVGIVGGPPCQGFSLKGKKLGINDRRNYLFNDYLDIVQAINPDFVVIENVKALTNKSHEFFLNAIINGLKSMGFLVNFAVLNAKNYGVPQSRDRVFIIANKKSSFNFAILPKTNVITVKDAISDLHFLNSGQGSFRQDYLLPIQSPYQQQMRQNSTALFNHQATNHSDIALQKLAMIPAEGDKSSLPKELWGKQKFSTTWGRLRWHETSPTIDTRFDTPSNGCNSHPILHRAITPREAARLQSFPDNFIFYGKKTEVCKQIGNAVPPKLAQLIAAAIKELL